MIQIAFIGVFLLGVAVGLTASVIARHQPYRPRIPPMPEYPPMPRLRDVARFDRTLH